MRDLLPEGLYDKLTSVPRPDDSAETNPPDETGEIDMPSRDLPAREDDVSSSSSESDLEEVDG